MSDSSADVLLGRVIDERYRLDELVGVGGHGRVYRAWHLTLEVDVALKVLVLPAFADDDRRGAELESVVREARALMRLKHRNIVSVLDAGSLELEDESSTAYLVMEWCPGRTIETLLNERKRLPLDETLPIIEPIADALAHAHATGVVHRDVKPSNVVLVENAGTLSPRLIDFGIAKIGDPKNVSTGGDSAATTSASATFTLAYAAPEQVVGSRTTPRTDVHALGLLFLEMLTGAPPYGTGGLRAIIDPVRPSLIGSEAGAYAAVIARAVALRPSDRFENAGAFHAALLDARGARVQEAPATQIEPLIETQSAEVAETIAIPAPQRRSRLWTSAPIVGSVAAMLVTIALRKAPDSQSTPAYVMASAQHGYRPPTYCELAEDEQRRRLTLDGFSLTSFEKSDKPRPDVERGATAVIEDAHDGVVSMNAMVLDRNAREDAAKRILSEATTELAIVPDLGVAYILDGNCLCVVKAPAEEARTVRDAVRGEEAVGALVGDTSGGPNPLGIPNPPLEPPRLAAHRLEDLSAAELTARLIATGVRINDVERDRSGSEGEWLALYFKRGGARGKLEYMSNAGARVYVQKRIQDGDRPLFYASAGMVAIIASGSVDASLLDRVLSGLGAEVTGVP